MNLSNTPFIKRVKRLFHAKNVVVVTAHAVDHYAFSLKAQVALAMLVLAVVGGASYSMGRYFEAQTTIEDQSKAIQQAEAENEKISNEYALLKRDLLRMDEEGDDLSDYAEFVLDQYQQSPTTLSEDTEGDFTTTASDNPHMFERIHKLETRLKQEQFEKKQFMNTIHHLTRQKIKELERAVQMTGMKDKISILIDTSAKKQLADAYDDLPTTAEGGPYVPFEDTLQTKLTEEAVVAEVMYLSHMVDTLHTLPISHPMPYGKFTSGYGRRVDPFRHTLANHTGIDYAGAAGSRALAAAKGRVIYASYNGAYGRVVDIDHGNGFVTRYGHLSRILVRRGASVARGQPIGIQGSTGRSTGNHLHFEVRYNGTPINPLPFIKAGQHVHQALK
jgi:murein DD-endopeptidase MepM/ murein hydrolase activator NlpD